MPDPHDVGPATFAESAALVPDGGDQGRFCEIQLIDAGWSKNGRYYPPETLAEAARGRVYPAGTAMFADHPTVSEASERPERSIKDLAARLVTDARYENGTLRAKAELFGPWRPIIKEMAEHIGVSIRAAGVLEYGEAEGREGPIVTSLTEGISVDFVTSPARGGKILELIESARAAEPAPVLLAEARNVGGWIESRIHSDFTVLADEMYGQGRLTCEERIALSSGIGDALAAFIASVEASQPQLFKRDLWQEPEAADTEMSEAAPENPAETPPPQETADPTRITENEPGSPPADETKEGSMPELTEAQVADLNRERDAALAEAAQAKALAESATADKAKTDLELARFKAVEAARPIAATLLSESDLPAASQTRLMGQVITSAHVPLTEASVLDESVYRTLLGEAIKAEQTYVASLLEGAGQGQPRDLGESATVPEVSAEATQTALAEAYRQRGMSPAAAQLAATGRPF